MMFTGMSGFFELPERNPGEGGSARPDLGASYIHKSYGRGESLVDSYMIEVRGFTVTLELTAQSAVMFVARGPSLEARNLRMPPIQKWKEALKVLLDRLERNCSNITVTIIG